MSTKQPSAGGERRRPSTEERLERAAIQILSRQGVLAGLNLQEVADRAGVNRSLVYHHFGSRQELLRAALRNHSARRRVAQATRSQLPSSERLSDFVAKSIARPTGVRLMALLALDGDRVFEALPLLERSRENYRRDIEEGRLDSDTDVDALLVAVINAVYGWVLFRKPFARALGIDARELDQRVEAILQRMYPTPSPAHSDSCECGAIDASTRPRHRTTRLIRKPPQRSTSGS